MLNAPALTVVVEVDDTKAPAVGTKALVGESRGQPIGVAVSLEFDE
jgi:hypothetical protein